MVKAVSPAELTIAKVTSTYKADHGRNVSNYVGQYLCYHVFSKTAERIMYNSA